MPKDAIKNSDTIWHTLFRISDMYVQLTGALTQMEAKIINNLTSDQELTKLLKIVRPSIDKSENVSDEELDNMLSLLSEKNVKRTLKAGAMKLQGKGNSGNIRITISDRYYIIVTVTDVKKFLGE